MFARFSPSAYNLQLHDIRVPGYGNAGGHVSVNRYLSGNPRFGGNEKAKKLYEALRAAMPDGPERQRLFRHSHSGVFSGQGLASEIGWVLGLIHQHREALSRVPDLRQVMARFDYLQALCDEAYIGVDCVGFVGGYLAAAGVDPWYGGYTPDTFFHSFPPILTLEEIRPLCIVVVASFAHVQIIDRVVERRADRVIVDLCQSTHTSGAIGPQTNRGVTIAYGRGDHPDIDLSRQLRAQHRNRVPGEDGDAMWDRHLALGGRDANERNFTRFLWQQTLRRGQDEAVLYNHRARMFRLGLNGRPANGLGGPCFIGARRGLEGVAEA
jgi:hypothetical protein